MQKKIISLLCGVAFLALIPLLNVSAEATTTSATIQALLDQIKVLQTQIESLQSQVLTLNQAKQEIKGEVQEVLSLVRSLHRGMTGDDVKVLQEMLSTDPEIYPEGLTTGYFGRLTEKAVRKFQQKVGIDIVGVVGPKTKAKLNEILEEGAGNSGKVPPGLLIAPGIRKKLGYSEVFGEEKIPYGIAKKLNEEEEEEKEEDTTKPIISNIYATSTKATSSIIIWTTNEESSSKVYYGTSSPLDITTSSVMFVESSDLLLGHEMAMSNLTASTTYYYIVFSVDNSDNEATSSEEYFVTLSE